VSSSTPPPPPTSTNAAYLGVAAVLGVAIVGLIMWKSCGGKTADLPTPTNPGPASSALNPSQIRPTNDVPPPPEDIDAAVEVDAGKPVSAMSAAGCDMKVCKGNATSEVQGGLQQRARQTRRSCYESALQQDESLKGHVEIAVRVGTNGQVCSASVASNDMGSPGVGQCVANMFRGAHVAPPSGGCVDVKVPISFVPGH
jgi:hypothetical protein